jgi:hypothetical protein
MNEDVDMCDTERELEVEGRIAQRIHMSDSVSGVGTANISVPDESASSMAAYCSPIDAAALSQN